MILSDTRILEEIEKKTIIIEPYNQGMFGSNQLRCASGKYLAIYNDEILDAKKHNQLIILKYRMMDMFYIPANFISV